MKQGKFSVFLILLLMLTLVVAPKEKAEAASSGWQPVSGISGCKIRVITDAYTYTKSATSIDAYAETNGKCAYPLNGLFWLHQQTGFPLRQQQAILCASRPLKC